MGANTVDSQSVGSENKQGLQRLNGNALLQSATSLRGASRQLSRSLISKI